VPPFALPHTNQLLEDHPLWDAGLVATERMVHLSLGQEGTTLLEDRLLERVMNSIRNSLGMRETEIAREPS
jgi:hypothetical protein